MECHGVSGLKKKKDLSRGSHGGLSGRGSSTSRYRAQQLTSLSLFLQSLDPWLHPKLLNMVSVACHLVPYRPTSLDRIGLSTEKG